MQHKNRFLCERSLSSIVVLLLFCTLNTAPAQTTLPAEDIAEKALAATVYLEMMDKNGKTLGIGSGFFVKSNLIATNYHVIEGAASGTAKLVGKYTTYNIEGLTATDKTNDLAILKVTAYGIKPLSLGDSNTVRIGETAYVTGNPKGLEGTFSDGIISSRRDKSTKERLQMTAPISPGSSGGPVLNRKGEVIGVSFAQYRALDAQNLNFAIPSKYLKKLLEQSKTTKPLSQGQQSISAETYCRRGDRKLFYNDRKGAIADFTQAIRLNPDYSDAYWGRGRAKASLGQRAAAISDYDKAIRLKPDFAIAYLSRADVKRELGQYQTAISDYNTAILLAPDNYYGYYCRGNFLMRELGQYASAVKDYTQCIQLIPPNPTGFLRVHVVSLYITRGDAKKQLGQYGAAIKDYTQAIHIAPRRITAYQKRADVKAKLGQYAAAITDYDTIIRLDPIDFIQVYIDRGNAKRELGQHQDAIKDYTHVIRSDISYFWSEKYKSEAYFNRAEVKRELGQHQDAIKDYTHVIHEGGWSAEVCYYRGIANARLGRTWEAKRNFQSALEYVKLETGLHFIRKKRIGASGDKALIADIKKWLRDLD